MNNSVKATKPPKWVRDLVTKKVYASAVAFGANNIVLSERIMAEQYIETRERILQATFPAQDGNSIFTEHIPSSVLKDMGEHTCRTAIVKLIDSSVSRQNRFQETTTVLVNSSKVSFGQSEQLLRLLFDSDHVECDLSEYLTHAMVDSPPSMYQKHEIILTPEVLKTLDSSETAFQKQFNIDNGFTSGCPFNPERTIVFSHVSSASVPVVKSHGKFFTFTALPDATSLYRPMLLEAKRYSKRHELVLQCIHRLLDQGVLRNDVSDLIVIGITGKSAYTFALRSIWEANAAGVKILREFIDIRTISVSSVCRLWQGLSAEADLYPSVVHRDCPDCLIINRFLRSMTPLFAYCRVVGVASSSNVVYKITLPQLRKGDIVYDRTCLAVDRFRTDFVIKVIRDSAVYKSEALCLETISRGLPPVLISREGRELHPARDFYAVGCMDCAVADGCPVFFQSEWDAYFNAIVSEETALLHECDGLLAMSQQGWWGRPSTDACTGGVIIMRQGDLKQSDGGLLNFMRVNNRTVMDETSLWLRLIHRSGVVQRDVRSRNIMMFGAGRVGFCRILGGVCPTFEVNGGFQVIDASLAGFVWTGDHTSTIMVGLDRESVNTVRNSITEPRLIDTRSGQYRWAGIGVHRAGVHKKVFEYNWSYSDDNDMWACMLGELGVPKDLVKVCDDIPAERNVSEEDRIATSLAEEAELYKTAVTLPMKLADIKIIVLSVPLPSMSENVVNEAVDRLVATSTMNRSESWDGPHESSESFNATPGDDRTPVNGNLYCVDERTPQSTLPDVSMGKLFKSSLMANKSSAVERTLVNGLQSVQLSGSGMTATRVAGESRHRAGRSGGRAVTPLTASVPPAAALYRSGRGGLGASRRLISAEETIKEVDEHGVKSPVAPASAGSRVLTRSAKAPAHALAATGVHMKKVKVKSNDETKGRWSS